MPKKPKPASVVPESAPTPATGPHVSPGGLTVHPSKARVVVTCPGCGKTRTKRADSPALRCRSCGARPGGQAPKPSRIRGETRRCARCQTEFWCRPSEGDRHFCTPECGNAAKRKDDHEVRVSARSAANQALNAGIIVRCPCEICGAVAQMHHEDYSKPLEVRWLCPEHHTALHVARGDLKAVAAEALA